MRISDSVKRVARTWAITFVGLYIPAILGFLGDVTQWANARGAQPFPDLSALAYAGVAAICASFVALLNLIVNKVEDGTGKTLPGIFSRPLVPIGSAAPTTIPGDPPVTGRGGQAPDRDTRNSNTNPW